MTNDEHYVPDAAYDALIDALMNSPACNDRRTQMIELLGGIGVWPMSCLADRDAAEMAQADLDAAMKHHTGTLSDDDLAVLEVFRAGQETYHAAKIVIAQDMTKAAAA
tara:strand:- start:1148 stop:1471 length:324 start_codon:yes stop_codon:yes gene_type:complete